jgi:hypothetical protein
VIVVEVKAVEAIVMLVVTSVGLVTEEVPVTSIVKVVLGVVTTVAQEHPCEMTDDRNIFKT